MANEQIKMKAEPRAEQGSVAVGRLRRARSLPAAVNRIEGGTTLVGAVEHRGGWIQQGHSMSGPREADSLFSGSTPYVEHRAGSATHQPPELEADQLMTKTPTNRLRMPVVVTGLVLKGIHHRILALVMR